MRKFLVLLACACGLTAGTSLAAQDCPPGPPRLETLGAQALQQAPRDRGLLWRLEKDGRTSWLYGTTHTGRVDWVIPGPAITAAVAASDVVALELDLGDPELQRAFAKPADPARNQRVLGGLRAQMDRAVARACMDAKQLASLSPLMQLALLTANEGRRDGFHGELAVDAVVWALARRSGKTVVGLETAEHQLQQLSASGDADEREIVARTLQDLESGKGREVLRVMLQAWAEGDELKLATYPEWCNCADTEAERRMYERLNDGRNPPMADKLAALHTRGSFFAAVGALHMTGTQALTDLLRARGFQVERVRFTR